LNRYHQPPEFLLTHPLNASRINDAHNRARQYPEVNKPINLNFQLMKARTLVLTSRDLTATKQQLVSQLKQTTGIKRQATEYGLVLVDSKNRAYQQAQKRLTRLRKTKPYNTPYLVAQADIYNATDKANLARQLLATNLELVPDNYPLQLAYGQTLLVKHNKADTQQAVTLFKSLAKQRPLDPLVWQQLARAEGQNGNLLGTYLAQAEYKFLTNDIKQALQQLGYALGQSKQNFPQQQRINQRITEIKAAQKLRF
jgi:predicted Zn-dependent protease